MDTTGTIRTKVVGVTHRNEDGTSRQDIIALLDAGDPLELYWDGLNEHDPNAIEVHTDVGEVVGFLSRDLAAEIAPHLEDGGTARVVVLAITGGDDDRPALGVNIEIELLEAGESVESAPAVAPQAQAVPAPAPTAYVEPEQPRPAGGGQSIAFIIAGIVILGALVAMCGGG